MAAGTSADARVRKTKRLLRTNLAKLMEEKSVGDITVKELCAACDINRSTFYLHYKDVYDLLHSIETQLEEGFERVLSQAPIEALYTGQSGHVLDGVCQYLADNADICRLFLCRASDNMALVNRVKAVVQDRALAQWRRLYGGRTEWYEYTFAFIASGCIGMLQLWLQNGMPQPPERMAKLMEAFIAKCAQALGERG